MGMTLVSMTIGIFINNYVSAIEFAQWFHNYSVKYVKFNEKIINFDFSSLSEIIIGPLRIEM